MTDEAFRNCRWAGWVQVLDSITITQSAYSQRPSSLPVARSVSLGTSMTCARPVAQRAGEEPPSRRGVPLLGQQHVDDVTFGGRGASWLGCFVGGELLVRGSTQGVAGELLYGNFPEHSRYLASI